MISLHLLCLWFLQFLNFPPQRLWSFPMVLSSHPLRPINSQSLSRSEYTFLVIRFPMVGQLTLVTKRSDPQQCLCEYWCSLPESLHWYCPTTKSHQLKINPHLLDLRLSFCRITWIWSFWLGACSYFIIGIYYICKFIIHHILNYSCHKKKYFFK